MRTGSRESGFGSEEIRCHPGERAGGVIEERSVVVDEAAGLDGHGADERAVDGFAQLLEPVGDIARGREARDIVKRECLERRLLLGRGKLGSTQASARATSTPKMPSKPTFAARAARSSRAAVALSPASAVAIARYASVGRRNPRSASSKTPLASRKAGIA